ncbi:EAL domain-containing protein (putative c-di-GMP-specific phosphodiesterase class I) [Rhodoligotrophos appendicifer]
MSRVRAIELAAASGAAGSQVRLSINFMPNAVYEPAACIRSTLTAAAKVGFDPKRIVFEFTENEPLDVAHVGHIVTEYKRMGFRTALDDFGAGYASLNLLAQFQPDIIKIDMELIRDVNSSASRQAIIGGIMAISQALEITVIAEGVETYEEVQALRAMGIQIFQGFYFGRPAVEGLPAVSAVHGFT